MKKMATIMIVVSMLGVGFAQAAEHSALSEPFALDTRTILGRSALSSIFTLDTRTIPGHSALSNVFTLDTRTILGYSALSSIFTLDTRTILGYSALSNVFALDTRNSAPVAADDSYTTDEDTALIVVAPGVLDNDTDEDGDSLTAVLNTNVGNGALTLNADGSFDYTPNTNFISSDSFTYHANDDGLDSNIVTVSITVNPVNDAPILTAIGDQMTDEDTDFAIDVSATDVDIATDGQSLTFTATSDDESLVTVSVVSTGVDTATLSLDVQDNQNGAANITVTVDDANGGVDSETFMLTVNPVNDAPILTAIGDQMTDEDTDFAIDVSATDVDIATDGQSLTFTATSDDESLVTVSIVSTGVDTATLSLDVQDNQNGAVNITVTVDDANGGVDSEIFILMVNPVNDPPEIISVTGPEIPVAVGTVVTMSVDFTDADIGAPSDTHTVTCEWDDGNTDTIDPATRPENMDHTYDNAGVYTVKFTVTDGGGASDLYEFQYVVVYAPDGGFVTGGGWINSPEGAYAADPELTGKANFGFVSKYKKKDEVPTGNTQFVFEAGDLDFHSESYEWLVVAHHKAKYKGSGTINDDGDYGFMLSAIDADLTPSTDVDLFRIKIWDKDNGDAIVYDNQMNAPDDADPTTEIGGGSIVIHGTDPEPDPPAAPALLPGDTALLAAYPNPTNPDVWIPYRLGIESQVTIRIYDVSSRMVRKLDLGYRPAGFYADKSKAAYWDGRNEAGEHVSSGIYFYNIQAGEFAATRKMIVRR